MHFRSALTRKTQRIQFNGTFSLFLKIAINNQIYALTWITFKMKKWLLTDKIQVCFGKFHHVGRAWCYILRHLRSMSFLEILLDNGIWNRLQVTICTCRYWHMVMTRTNFAFHSIYLQKFLGKIYINLFCNSNDFYKLEKEYEKTIIFNINKILRK